MAIQWLCSWKHPSHKGNPCNGCETQKINGLMITPPKWGIDVHSDFTTSKIWVQLICYPQWIGLKENLNRKLSIFPWNIGVSCIFFLIHWYPSPWPLHSSFWNPVCALNLSNFWPRYTWRGLANKTGINVCFTHEKWNWENICVMNK